MIWLLLWLGRSQPGKDFTMQQVALLPLFSEGGGVQPPFPPVAVGGKKASPDFVKLVRRMRTQQRTFFKKGIGAFAKSEALREARKLEKEVDQFLDIYEEEAKKWEEFTSSQGEE